MGLQYGVKFPLYPLKSSLTKYQNMSSISRMPFTAMIYNSHSNLRNWRFWIGQRRREMDKWRDRERLRVGEEQEKKGWIIVKNNPSQ
uniref:Uncharacterized protein n=1 Tax=Rhizophora mucronata TaxID=61149 RepID=A0A2P2PCZ7_RHIMU